MFSMCSELTPRAPIPDGRMAQTMQLCWEIRSQAVCDENKAMHPCMCKSQEDLSDFIHRSKNSLDELYVVKGGCREPSGYTLNKPEHSVMKNNKILKETLAGVIGPSFATQLRPATSLWPPPPHTCREDDRHFP